MEDVTRAFRSCGLSTDDEREFLVRHHIEWALRDPGHMRFVTDKLEKYAALSSDESAALNAMDTADAIGCLSLEQLEIVGY